MKKVKVRNGHRRNTMSKTLKARKTPERQITDSGAIARNRVVALSEDLAEEFEQDTGSSRGKWTYAALRLGISVNLLSAIRQSRYPRLGLPVIERIAKGVGCPVGALTDPE